MLKLRSEGSHGLYVLGVSIVMLGCFTYSASITVESKSTTLADRELTARANAVVEGVADEFGMASSAMDLEAMRRAARDEDSEYQPLAVYRNTYRSPVRTPGRILLVLQDHRSERGVRIIIRDLKRDEATEFTDLLEQEIVKRLKTTIGSLNVDVHHGTVGPSIYAP